MKKTWPEIREAAAAAGFIHGWSRAEDNAHSTIYVEKEGKPEDFDALALGTLESLLAYDDLDPAERDFYINFGVDF